ncbi:MAG: helix-turn-helix domain-containing protein [Defluviitaleaceae bacterium]|nr:helix-turn-helix domain-containing protein [Defluviitaleaceae bacterium]
MLSSQILQNTIDGLKNITRREFSVLEREGKVTSSTEADMLNTQVDAAADFVRSAAESQLVQGYQYFKVFDNGIAEYVVLIKGEDEETYRIGKIAAFQIQGLIVAYKERFDRDNFIKNLLLDNLLLVDIYGRAKKLRIENTVRRVVYVIEARGDEDTGTVEIVRNIFPAKTRDFVTVVDQDHIILVKELKNTDAIDDIEAHAKAICDTLATEAMSPVRVAIGTCINDLKFVSRSYKEAKMALEVGKIFDVTNLVTNYETLGIGRLIYQLPMSLCRMFVNEVLNGITIDSFDEETLVTVDKFFDNNLNVSETSRQLYIHRNTLVYRLDKLQKLTGLDLRNFDDAIIFKITMMVSKYMRHKENQLF